MWRYWTGLPVRAGGGQTALRRLVCIAAILPTSLARDALSADGGGETIYLPANRRPRTRVENGAGASPAFVTASKKAFLGAVLKELKSRLLVRADHEVPATNRR